VHRMKVIEAMYESDSKKLEIKLWIKPQKNLFENFTGKLVF
jgi:hypothetical protein